MKQLITIIIFTLCCFFQVYAQNNTTNDVLTYEAERQNRVANYLEHNPKANSSQLRSLVDVINGKPIYAENHNINASEATRTNFLQLGGDLGLDLEGEGIDIGIWEVGGHPLLTHLEFRNNRGLSKISIGDDVEQASFHSSHVAGTLVAIGLNPSAKGMASKSNLLAFDNLSDVTEALVEARDNGLKFSNHSYGVPVDNLEGNEWYMGAYSNVARAWDAVLNINPYYLMVVSAGNDGNANYPGGLDSRLDKLTGNKNSKNNLVVANASNIVLDNDGNFQSGNINTSSSQGPTDDGRIKPDITGLGTQILSTSNTNNSAYGVETGTSMAAPNITGSATLLQELYFNLNNEYMLASTLKNLIFITADDAGDVGPDPLWGWGIMNSKKAAETILDNGTTSKIYEYELQNDENLTFNVSKDGAKELKIGVVWTDVRGEALENQLNNPRASLVNDIDLKVLGSDQTEYFPWKLDLANLSDGAIKGVNNVDNVEVVEIDDKNANTYQVEISHKGVLDGGKQMLSIIITGMTSTTLNSIDFKTENIAFWPNPVKNKLNITSAEFDLTKNTRISIYDMVGRKVIDKKDFSSTSNLSIDTSTLSKGIYILKLTDGAQSIQKRIIKE
ncbi:S8 family serine peptidase [Psychroflexus salinarum]|uniref:S8 family serine peptidase n=1 Tax=Psychroflexus salinarum TaxID=546024 RepID=A0ABW3GQD7_9FLAO